MTTGAELVDRFERAAAGTSDLAALSRAVFRAIERDIPFAFACVASTDPASELVTGAVKSHPLDTGEDDFAAAEWGEPDVNQLAEISRRPVPVGVLSVDTDGDVTACRRFRDYMIPVFGFTDEVRLACRSRGATWAFLALYRGAGEPAFTRADAELVSVLHEPIARHVQRLVFAEPALPSARSGDAAVMVLTADNTLAQHSAAVEDRIAELGGREHGSLPGPIVMAAARARSSSSPAVTRVRGHEGRWLSVSALALDGPGGGAVVVTVDEADPVAIGRLALTARGLTGREQEIAHLVLKGASTRSIAETLFLSPHTVQDHLKSVFRKLEVNSRREMIAQLVLT